MNFRNKAVSIYLIGLALMIFNLITANSAKWGEMLDVNIHKTINKLTLKRKTTKARINAKKGITRLCHVCVKPGSGTRVLDLWIQKLSTKILGCLTIPTFNIKVNRYESRGKIMEPYQGQKELDVYFLCRLVYSLCRPCRYVMSSCLLVLSSCPASYPGLFALSELPAEAWNRQAWQVTSHPKSPMTTGNEDASGLLVMSSWRFVMSSCLLVLSPCLPVVSSCLPVALSCLFRGYPKI